MNVACPMCKKEVEWSSASVFRPFCSKQCQLIDLGEWANEEKAIPSGGNKDQETIALPDIEDIEAMLAEKGDDFFQ
ncbi:MAG: DNA gyrase inhibitor YacG [Paraglaciecola sp.]|uniref:DNA gyrase inhibitor YacG n=1 Tax=Paraglaciecola sp. TaxID=1920173 RepID=UPI00273D4822|nr:DNA gyrase inhibitor YacG [Paraglaciecola sp.]MDP5029296.1 DNA gyrase inhibitor YacG [Paraglaciecola sp.]MDP5041650.1 DNA gyrase inhibitor YacG [Paraglaciecola sp.]MDP5131068.1 DNA gyrase inhibitor YacG [Paraglaciecola sp.]